jgi:hypothetical protein
MQVTAGHEFTGIPAEMLRHTHAPISTELIREFFTNKELFFKLNHSESKLQGASFLTYVANLDIPADICFNPDIEYDEYCDIMNAYFAQNSIVKLAGLHVMAADLLLTAKSGARSTSVYLPVVSDEFVYRFIEQNKEVVDKCLQFIDSTQVFALASIRALAQHYTPSTRFPVVDDRSFVGANLAMLYRIPEFIAIYFSIEGASYNLSYFVQQFEGYIFKNEHLSKHFNSRNNIAALLYQHFAAGTFVATDITSDLFNIGVFDPSSPYYEEKTYEAVQARSNHCPSTESGNTIPPQP